MVKQFIENPRTFGGPVMRMFYNEDVLWLIVKIPKRPREVATIHLDHLIAFQTDRIGLRMHLNPVGSATLEDPPYSKEPDASYLTLQQPPGRTDKWPALVIETGYSESLGRLRVDAEWWLVRSRGDVQVVILTSVHQTKPEIIMEKWELDRNVPPLRPMPKLRQPRLTPIKTQEISLTLADGDTTVVTGDPLIIRFEDIFLSPAASPREQDYVFTESDLKEISEFVWKTQGFILVYL